MQQTRFAIARIPETEEAADTFLEKLDAQIDELSTNLQLLQSLRRATAAAFGVDRRDGVGVFGEMADSARRAEYEGGSTEVDGRLVPRGRFIKADAAEAIVGDDLKSVKTRAAS